MYHCKDKKIKLIIKSIRLIYKLKCFLYKKNIKKIPISKILIGQQAGHPLDLWINITKELGRISCPIIDSPYVKFLQGINKHPNDINNQEKLMKTSYFSMAKICIKYFGNYMGAKNDKELFIWMKEYYEMYLKIKDKNNNVNFANKEGHSSQNSMITVNKIKYSDCYEIVDGHHRVAINYILGKKNISVVILGKKLSTLQKQLIKINQVDGRKLYQPVDRMEVKSWPMVRRCGDRFKMMSNFLNKKKITKGSVIDLACSYGWFLNAFKQKNFNVLGVDRDPTAINIAKI